MRFTNLLLAAAAVTGTSALTMNKRQSATQVGTFAGWAEGIAARPNGQLLVTMFDAGQVWTLDPATGATEQIATLEDATCTGAISEYAPDQFAVVAGQFSLFGGGPSPAGTWTVWTIDMTGDAPVVEKLKNIPEAGMLNGLTTLDEDTILTADAEAGTVYRLSVSTGEYSIALADPSMEPSAGAIVAMGIDGVQYQDGYVYFTNVFGNTFNKVAVDETGEATGAVEQIWGDASGDDFCFGPDGSQYVASTQNNGQMIMATLEGVISTAGSVASPTACIFGRGEDDQNTIYVATSSGGIFSLPAP